MAVTIRMARFGRKKIPFYRIVATDKQMKRDGRYLELLGTVDPRTDPITVTLKEDRVKYWIGVGAQTSDTMAQIIETKLPGYLADIQKNRRAKIQAKRKARKTKAGGKKKAAVKPGKAKRKAAKKKA